MKKYVIISIITLLGWITVLTLLLKREQEEKNRLKANQITLLSEVDYYSTRDSLSAASVERLQLIVKEYKTYFADQAKKIDALEIKLKRVNSISSTATETAIPIHIALKDSIVLRDSLVRLECLELHDPHIDLSGCLEQKHFRGKITIRDTLTHIVHRVPKKWLFFRWGTKAIRMDIVSSNPYTQITYARYIELK